MYFSHNICMSHRISALSPARYEWVDEWMPKLTNEWMNERTDGRKDGRTDGRMNLWKFQGDIYFPFL